MKELRLEYRSPEELADNAANYKMHPRAQMVALDSIIGKVGWAGAALYNERTKRLIDGHARKGVAMKKGGKIPVLIGDWSEEEERLILATLDPVGQMYQRLESQYADLTSGLDKAGAEMAKSLEEAVQDLQPPAEDSGDIDLGDGEIEEKEATVIFRVILPKASAQKARREMRELAERYGGTVMA